MPAFARPDDELCNIAGAGCPYTLPIGGRPLIRAALQTLREAGAGEVAIVVSPAIAADVMLAAGDPGVRVRYVLHDPETSDEAAIARAVRDAIGPGPVLVHLAKSLVPSGLEARLASVFTAGGDVIAYALGDVPATRLAPGDGPRVELQGAWRYDGTVDGVLAANTLALDSLTGAHIGADLSNASVEGRVSVHPTALLDGAKILGPAVIGPGARLIEAYVGPYTSIGADVHLEGVEIERSIVLDGARIRYPGRRLEASLIGEGARIGRDYSLPSALRFRVGPGADIQLS